MPRYARPYRAAQGGLAGWGMGWGTHVSRIQLAILMMKMMAGTVAVADAEHQKLEGQHQPPQQL